MKQINLRELYPDTYKTDTYVEVTDEVLEAIKAQDRMEAALERKKYRYKANYSLDRGDGIEYSALFPPLSPEESVLQQAQREKVYAAIIALPSKQAKRIYARFYLNMTVTDIASAEGVSPRRIRDSIQKGLEALKNKLEEF